MEETQQESPQTQEQPNQDSNPVNDEMEIEVPVFNDANGDPVIERVSLKELKGGYLRHSDYTRKTQELAKQREEIGKKPETAPSDEIAAVEILRKKYWFVTKEELEQQTRQINEDKKLEDIIEANPDLKQFEWAIKEIWSKSDMAYEDIIAKYGFLSKDKLEKARNSRNWLKGSLDRAEKPKSVKDMTREEYLKHKNDIFAASRKNSWRESMQV